MSVDLRKRPTAWAEATAQLDHALAGLRLLSRAITEATDRRDTLAIVGLSALRRDLGADVDRLLRVTSEALRHE